jgi:16S rRNA (cytidine1402-2'-O)-methyltransferase
VTAPGTLYLVATPIGNLGDLGVRARETLASVALVAAEDTRHSGQLLRTLGLSLPLLSLHAHNETARSGVLLERLLAGASVALLSDAGTPLIADPGYELVARAKASGIRVVPIPGPCAAIAALMVAGLPAERFCFEGFLPARAAARKARLALLAREERTLVFYEAPHRIQESLADLAAAFGARSACVGRELTKLHESIYDGTLPELAARAATEPDFARGELVVVVAGAEAPPPADESSLQRMLRALLAELPLSRAVEVAVKISGERRRRLYQMALALKTEPP